MTLFDPPAPARVVPLPPRWRPGLAHVALTVVGDPVQQGSKQIAPARGKAPARLIDDNPHELKAWRKALASVGIRAMAHRPPIDAPVHVRVAFTVARPPSVTRPYPSVKPDLDKLLRAVLDGLVQGDGTKARRGAVLLDDARVVEVVTRKLYPGDDPEALPAPGATINVWEIG